MNEIIAVAYLIVYPWTVITPRYTVVNQTWEVCEQLDDVKGATVYAIQFEQMTSGPVVPSMRRTEFTCTSPVEKSADPANEKEKAK